MALSTPQATVTTGTGISSSAANQNRDNVDWVASASPSCAASGTAATPLPTATTTVLPLALESRDIGGMHSTVTNTSRLTVPAGGGGLYSVTAYIQLTSSVPLIALSYLSILKNGAAVPGMIQQMNGLTFVGFAGQVTLVAGDFIELAFVNNSGSALTVLASGGSFLTADWQKL